MRIAAAALALASFVTVPQHDAQRSNLDAPYVSVSGDGRYVALVSQAQLVPADTDELRDVYVLDRAAGSVSLESVQLQGSPPEDTDSPALSHDGRFLVYESGDRVVWRDRQKDVTTSLGVGREPAISGDGRFTAYTSPEGVMLFDATTHATRNVSVDAAGRVFPNASSAPTLSGDGRYLAYASTAPLTAAATAMRAESTTGRRRPLSQVYVSDLHNGTTRMASVAMGGKPADNDSWSPAISADGCALAFVSNSTNLVRGDRNRSSDIFLLNLVNFGAGGSAEGSIELISRNAKGESGNGGSRRPALSMDGQAVVFQSEASDLVKPDADINLLPDVFLFDRRAGRMSRLSADPASEWMEASGGPTIDASGRIVAFSSRHPINAADKRNDFDLFVLDLARLSLSSSR